MKKIFSNLLKLLLITTIIFVVAIAAAPYFVRQDQIKNFIQSKIKLSEGDHLVIDGDIGFGLFPYSFIKAPKALVIDKSNSITIIENAKFGFNLASLIKKDVKFDVEFHLRSVDYAGHIEFSDYQNFISNRKSPVIISLEKPFSIDASADFEVMGSKVSLKNIKATHKQTELTGNFESDTEKGLQKITANGSITTQNLDDLRKLYKLVEVENDFNLLSGSGKIDFDLSTSGIKSADFIANMNGKGSMNISDATIYGLDFNEIIGAPQTVQIEPSYDRKIDISKADATFTITNGVAKTEDMEVSNQLATARVHGEADFVNKLLALNIDINTDLAAAQFNIPLAVSGSFDSIKITPRAGDALLNNLNAIKDLSKIRLNDVKVNIGKESIEHSLDRIKDIGSSMGLDVGSIINKNKKLKKITDEATQPAPAQEPAPAPVPAE